MKGKIIDVVNSEAFIALEDDTILKVSLSQMNQYLHNGSMINIDFQSESFNYCNNHKPTMQQDKLMDFF